MRRFFNGLKKDTPLKAMFAAVQSARLPTMLLFLGTARGDAFLKLLVLSGLRDLIRVVEEKVRCMAVLDVKNNMFNSKVHNQGLQQGLEKAVPQDIARGRQPGFEKHAGPVHDRIWNGGG